MSYRNLGERTTSLRGNVIGKTRRSNKPGELTEQHRREETTKKAGNNQKTCYTPRRQGSNRTGKTERRNRNRGAATGDAKPERHSDQSDGPIIDGNNKIIGETR